MPNFTQIRDFLLEICFSYFACFATHFSLMLSFAKYFLLYRRTNPENFSSIGKHQYNVPSNRYLPSGTLQTCVDIRTGRGVHGGRDHGGQNRTSERSTIQQAGEPRTVPTVQGVLRVGSIRILNRILVPGSQGIPLPYACHMRLTIRGGQLRELLPSSAPTGEHCTIAPFWKLILGGTCRRTTN